MAKASKVEISSEHFGPFLKAKEALDKQIKAEGETAVKAFFKEYFEKYPDVYGVRWTQYTPYFNDGEACVFGLNSVYTYKTKEAFETGEMNETEDANECYNEEPQISLDKIQDILETIFGDHAEVSVTRKAIEVTEYEHD